MHDDAFHAAARRWQHRVFSYAAYTLGDPAEAEEVTQDVLLALWRHPEMLDSERLEGWLLRVARNACIDEVRRRRARLRLVDPAVADEVVRRRELPAASPERRAASAQLRRRLARELAALPEPQRSVVVLREVHGLTYREIGGVCDLSLASVKTTLHRGRARLRERLKEVRDEAVAV